jgi:hypothetical protein
MQTSTFSRPTLPPLSYALFLPMRGAYLLAVDSAAGCFRVTADPRRACSLPEPSARDVGVKLIQATGEPVELRSLTR